MQFLLGAAAAGTALLALKEYDTSGRMTIAVVLMIAATALIGVLARVARC